MSVLYCQSPALFWCALALIVCFFVRRGAHRVRAVLDLVLGLLCIVGGVALYYLGMYNDAFTIRDFWQIRTAGWIGLAAVVLLTAWQVIKATRRSVSVRRAARQAERDEKARQKELEDARSRAYAAGQEDAKAASRVAENVSAADSRETPRPPVSMNKKSAPGGGTFLFRISRSGSTSPRRWPAPPSGHTGRPPGPPRRWYRCLSS